MKINKWILIFSALTLASCGEDFLEPEVTTSKDVATSVSTVEDLNGILLGAYDRMNAATYLGRDYIIFAEVRSDNAFSNGNSGRFVGPGQFALSATDAYPSDTWTQIYRVIANANIVINSTTKDQDTDEAKHVKGEAYAVRAMAHMDLLRLFGEQYYGGTLGIPYVTEYNSSNLYPARSTVDEVWAKIGEDLDQADLLMSESLNSTAPTRITTYGVAALKSRYYLYTEQYDQVIVAAEKVISSGKFTLATPTTFNSSFSGSGGTTSVFELAFTSTDNLSNDALFNIFQGVSYGDIEATTDLYSTYETTDVRRSSFTVNGSKIRITAKYPNLTSNIRVIRYAEVVLNYAEALAITGASNALAVLNTIPSNRNASLYAEATVANVRLERRKELAMEGHRFFDLMRYESDIEKVDSRQTFVGTEIPYGSHMLAFPIPQAEINANPTVVQNRDY